MTERSSPIPQPADNDPCPEIGSFKALASGRLSAEAAERLRVHADSCPRCSTLLRHYASGPKPPLNLPTDESPVTTSHSPGYHVDTMSQGSDEPSDAGVAEAGPAGPLVSIGRYQVVRQLGRGGFGEVYLAHDQDLDRDVAIKIPRLGRRATPEDLAQYRFEARALAAVEHPHIVPVYDVGRYGEHAVFFVSKYIAGEDLRQRLARGRPSFTATCSIIAAVATGLHAAHQHELVHRDVKPANILLDANDHPFISDFGLALAGQNDAPPEVADIFRGYAGTVPYMSPEQARGESHRSDRRSDVFSLGVVLYQMLTGKLPFEGADTQEIFQAILTRTPTPPRAIDASIPAELERICLKMLAKRASERYQTALDVADELRLWESGDEAADVPLPGGHLNAKGLASFDAGDAGPFVQLLPGPYGRGGVPDSLLLWKRRIEQGRFSVGLLLGVTGAGKSSYVKAGILPRLHPRVVTVYVEATRRGLVAQLHARLLDVLPRTARRAGLREQIMALRSGRELPEGRRVLLVIDQFEQALVDADPDGQRDELIAALRQCSGESVQCLLVARDDFAASVAAFFAELDIPLSQSTNFAILDCFSRDHARTVLRRLGSSLDKLPAPPEPLTPDQAAFLERGLDQLMDNERIRPIQLALFAEIFRHEPWEAERMRRLGGLTVAAADYLEAATVGSHAHPLLATHASAVDRILAVLLPPPAQSIAQGIVDAERIRREVPLQDRRELANILNVLEFELKLIVSRSLEDPDRGTVAGYQLSHDTLVPAIRTWQTRRRRQESWRGQASLVLEQRAAAWKLERDPRALPGLWEWIRIRLGVPGWQWQSDEQQMMSAANRRWTSRIVATCVLAGIVLAGGIGWRRSIDRSAQARQHIEQILTGDSAHLPEHIDALRPATPQLLARFAGRLRDPELSGLEALRGEAARYALAGGSHDRLATLLTDPGITFDEAYGLRPALRPALAGVRNTLHAAVLDPATDEGIRLRSAMFLAASANTEDQELLRQNATFLCRQLVTAAAQNRFEMPTYVEAFRPAREALSDEFLRLAAHDEAGVRDVATDFLYAYVDDVNRLSTLATQFDLSRYRRFLPKLRQRPRQATLQSLETLLHRRPRRDDWHDTPLEGAWTAPAEQLVRRLEAAGGGVHPHFAYCSTLSVDELPEVLDAMADAGYRPQRVRPAGEDQQISVATIWLRDGRRWRLRTVPDSEALLQIDEEMHRDDFFAVDVTAYVDSTSNGAAGPYPPDTGSGDPGTGLKYVGVWVEAQPREARETRIVAFPADEDFRNWLTADATPVGRLRTHQLLDHAGARMHLVILSASKPSYPAVFWSADYAYGDELIPLGRLQNDVSLARKAPRESVAAASRRVLEETQTRLDEEDSLPDGVRLALEYRRALCLYRLDDLEPAREQLDALIEEFPRYQGSFRKLRGQIFARQGREERALEDLKVYVPLATTAGHVAFTQAAVHGWLGEWERAAGFLEAARTATEDAELQFRVANGYAVLADAAQRAGEAERHGQFSAAAVAALEVAVNAGYPATHQLAEDPEFAVLRDFPAFQDFLRRHRLDIEYSTVWRVQPELESTDVFCFSHAEHRRQAEALASTGYRPVSVDLSFDKTQGRPVIASVWQRPSIPRESLEASAMHRALVHHARFQLGDPGSLLATLRRPATVGEQTAVIQTATACGLTARDLYPLLVDEENAQARHCLLLMLGTMPSAAEVPEFAAYCRGLVEQDPHAGVHSAAAWALERLGVTPPAPTNMPADPQPETRRPQAVTEPTWLRNSLGQTLAVAGPNVEFLMGAAAGSFPLMDDQETKWHRRRIRRRFAMSTTEVTSAELHVFLDESPDWAEYYRQYGREQVFSPDQDGPACCVDLPLAAAFCRWLTFREGLEEEDQCFGAPLRTNGSGSFPQFSIEWRPLALERTGYRLPTEAEWEYMARAGSAAPRYYGSAPEWLGAYEHFHREGQTERVARAVAALMPNRFGMFDMLGNVAEITTETRTTYRLRLNQGIVEDPNPPGQVFTQHYRLVYRGMSFAESAELLRCSARVLLSADLGRPRGGLRLCRTIPTRPD